jgi:hypothetical protein
MLKIADLGHRAKFGRSWKILETGSKLRDYISHVDNMADRINLVVL